MSRANLLLLVAAVALSPLIREVRADGVAPAHRPIAAVIDDYVRIGLESNLNLANQTLTSERAQLALSEARSQLLPQLDLNARYTSNSGGREIDVPVAQLLNPAYQTLNQLLLAAGQPARFSLIPDSSFPLLRTHEQDSHLSLRQPLYAPGLSAAFRSGTRWR